MSEYKDKYFHLKADFELYKSHTRKCDEVFTQQSGVICRKTFEKAILEQQLKETQEKLKIAVSALENLIDNTEHGVKQWQAAWSPNKETKAQTSIRAARQALEKIGAASK